MKVGIGKASKILGVSIETIRRWDRAGKIPSERTPQGHRRYDLSKISQNPKISKKEMCRTIAYARVSSHDQKLEKNYWMKFYLKKLDDWLSHTKIGCCVLVQNLFFQFVQPKKLK